MAGYSGTPLPQKLGIKPDSSLYLVNPPDGIQKTLGTLLSGVVMLDHETQRAPTTAA